LPEQHGGDPVALKGIRHDEGHFGLRRVIKPVKAADRDQLVTLFDNESDPVPAINRGQVRNFFGPQINMRIEIPHRDGVLGQMRVKANEGPGIFGSDRSNYRCRSIAEIEHFRHR
jgi:hypothetical protein